MSEKLAAMGSLVSGVAHEIRTPLAYISNHLYMAQRRLEAARASAPEARRVAEDVAPLLDIASQGVDRINRLVGDLRRFTRHHAGERADADLASVVREAVDIFRATHQGRILLDADLRAAPVRNVDRVQIQQVVLNLLDNAAEAMLHGGRVRIATSPAPGGATLVVADEGPGMTPEIQARMYDEFFTTKKEGTGLGLSIVRRIVEAHDGSIRCATEPGKGTTFTLTFGDRKTA